MMGHGIKGTFPILPRNNTTDTETTAYIVLARVQALVRSNKGELKEASYNRAS